jgi:diacylglycerol O-acyltransferase
LGLNADRDAIGDLDVLAQCLRDSLEELLNTTVRGTTVRQPTRKAPAAARRAAAKKAAARQEATAQKRAAVRDLVARAAELGTGPAPTSAAKSPAESVKPTQTSDKSRALAPKKSAGKKPRPKVVPKQPPGEEGSNR